MDVVDAAVAVLAGYVLGSVPVAVLVARTHDVDPRRVGDRNPGYWNVKEQLGRSAALPVFVGDTTKGALAGAVGVLLDGSAWGIAYAAVGAAMIGHAFPLFAGFRGGRSILAFVGGMIVVAPVAAAVAGAAFGATWVVIHTFWAHDPRSRTEDGAPRTGVGAFGVAARLGVFGFPVAQALVEPVERVAATGALLCIIGARFAQAAWRERAERAQA